MNAQNLLRGWTSAKLSSLIETFERGISYTSEDIQDMHGLPLVNLACIDKSGFYRDGELKSFSGSYTKSDLIYPLDMLIACTDLTRNADIIGTPILVPTDYEEYVYTMDLAKLKPKPCIDNRFLYYALKTSTYRNYIKPWASGTNVLHLNLQGVYDYVLQFPIDIKEQRRIANLLSALDSKIAINRAINQNLEALAKQLYDYWFVQFDFPDEEDKPYKSSGGAMMYSNTLRRNIPSNWEVKELGSTCEILLGGTPDTGNELYWGGSYAWLNSAQPTNPVECVQSLTQKHVAKRYMIGEKFLPLRHES